MHIGKKIKLLRHLNGMNQEELSQKIGKTRALISHIEQTGKVHHETLLTILGIFNISEEEFKNFQGSDIKIGKAKDQKLFESELSDLKEELSRLKKENDILKDLVESQKEIVNLLKDKSKK